MFDTHTHLNDETLFLDWQNHLKEFIQVGGNTLVNVATNDERAMRAIHIAQESTTLFPDCTIKATIGFHPSETCFPDPTNPAITKENIYKKMDTLKNIYEKYSPFICAIGEAGIDLHYEGAKEKIALQQELLALQCQMASEYNLPLIIHSRDGFKETIDILQDFSQLRIVFHCFGYTPKEAEYLLSHYPQIYFGFDGNITYPKAEALRETCTMLPRDRILLETDAPYLSPIPFRGQMNTPKNIHIIYKFVAELLGENVGNLYDQIDRNGYEFYKL